MLKEPENTNVAHYSLHVYVYMHEKVMVSIEETVSLGQGERGSDRDSYFPNPVS